VDGERSLIAFPLRLGPLCADGYSVSRSGIRWLIQPGQYCRAKHAITGVKDDVWH
jgi:hypothetical protein